MFLLLITYYAFENIRDSDFDRVYFTMSDAEFLYV